MSDQNKLIELSGETPWKKKAEMAEYYRCDIKTITNWMRRRILPFIKIGRFVRFDVRDCDRAMEKYIRRSTLGTQTDTKASTNQTVSDSSRSLQQDAEANRPRIVPVEGVDH